MSEEKMLTKKKESLLGYNWSIIKSHKKLFLILFAGLVVIYSFLYGLWKIPVIGFGINRFSSIGITDYLFIFGASAFVSIFITLWRYERKQRVANSELALGFTGGGIAALVAGICPVCQSLAIVAFGTTLLNVPTAFLTPYLGVIKIISIGFLALVVYLKADSVYTKTCKTCLIVPKPKRRNV